jgi:glycosyltransferase involved in cell wall biosynthesis
MDIQGYETMNGKPDIAFLMQPIDPPLPRLKGSIGLITLGLARHLGIERSLVVLTGPDPAPEPVAGPDGGLPFVRLKTPAPGFAHGLGGGLPGVASPDYARAYFDEAAARIREIGPAIVHVHNFPQAIGSLRRRGCKARLVLHMHCNWLAELPDGLVGPNVAQADAVIGCSEYIASEVRARFPDVAARTWSLPNGVDTGLFTPPGANRPSRSSPVVLYVGRLSPEKGIHLLVEAFELLLREVPDASLVLAGGLAIPTWEMLGAYSDDPLVRDLEPLAGPGYANVLAGRLGALPRGSVRVLGHVPHEGLPAVYRDADLFVAPSIWKEPFGIPLAEAMASGLPVIGTAGGGMDDIVEQGRTGLLVERGEVRTLAPAMAEMLRSPERMRRWGEAGRVRAVARFDWSLVTERLTRIYRSLC